MLDGYKTYIVAVLIGLVAVARAMGWIDGATADTINALLMGGGFAALRAAK